MLEMVLWVWEFLKNPASLGGIIIDFKSCFACSFVGVYPRVYPSSHRHRPALPPANNNRLSSAGHTGITRELYLFFFFSEVSESWLAPFLPLSPIFGRVIILPLLSAEVLVKLNILYFPFAECMILR